jgi:hypothetical protein
MDGSRFDAWTRRKFGLALGNGVAFLVGLGQLDDAAAKKKKRKNKKRCKKLTRTCTPGAKKRCCKGLRCDRVEFADDHRCCRRTQTACTSDDQCCRAQRCDEIFPGREIAVAQIPTPVAKWTTTAAVSSSATPASAIRSG